MTDICITYPQGTRARGFVVPMTLLTTGAYETLGDKGGPLNIQ